VNAEPLSQFVDRLVLSIGQDQIPDFGLAKSELMLPGAWRDDPVPFTRSPTSSCLSIGRVISVRCPHLSGFE
jgi:hypothetical protein